MKRLQVVLERKIKTWGEVKIKIFLAHCLLDVCIFCKYFVSVYEMPRGV